MRKFSNDPLIRLQELRDLPENEKKDMLQKLTNGSPIRPWPYGMPCSAMPLITIIGVSPGNNPCIKDRGIKTSGKSGEIPTFAEPPKGFNYQDTNYYWSKTRKLCWELLRLFNPDISENDAISLSSHLNFGTGQFGRAGEDAIEEDILKWVSTLLNSFFQTKIVVLYGLYGILKQKKYNNLWNNENGIKIDWSLPNRSFSFSSIKKEYKFRIWTTKNILDEDVLFVTWPNHPSRHPFKAKADDKKWEKSILGFQDIIKNEYPNILNNSQENTV